jgi:uncharacterized Tic20 family protein
MDEIRADQKLLAMAAHISYFLGGLGFVIAPLVIFLLEKNDYFVYSHAKQALVAHLTILVASAAVSLACLLLVGVLLLPILAILWLILIVTSIIAAVKAFQGEYYDYPFIQKLVNKL